MDDGDDHDDDDHDDHDDDDHDHDVDENQASRAHNLWVSHTVAAAIPARDRDNDRQVSPSSQIQFSKDLIYHHVSLKDLISPCITKGPHTYHNQAKLQQGWVLFWL